MKFNETYNCLDIETIDMIYEAQNKLSSFDFSLITYKNREGIYKFKYLKCVSHIGASLKYTIKFYL